MEIGYLGSVLASIRLIPQIYKSVRSNYVGVSLGTLLLDLTSCICFLIYAIYTNTMPFVISNMFSTCTNLILIGIVLNKRYKMKVIKT